MMFVDDQYILGVIAPHLKRCPVCHEPKQRVIDVAEFRVPTARMTPAATIMWDRTAEELLPGIGITCGCYARLHRQLGHINHSQLEAGKV